MSASRGVRDRVEVQSLSELLVKLSGSTEHNGKVSVADLVAAVGRRSFAPLLLAPGILIVTPLSGIPGLPTVGAIVIVLVAFQMVLGREHVWLPRFLARREMSARRLNAALTRIQPVAAAVDLAVRPRLVFLTRGLFGRLIAAVCMLIALMIPPMELVPLSSSVAALVISLLALGLAVHDGLLVLVGLTILAGALYFGAEMFMTIN